MEFEIGSVIKMKKPHPCGENRWEILRVGMDFPVEMPGVWAPGDGSTESGREKF